MKPLLKFTPEEDGVYWVQYKGGHYELHRCKAYEPLYLDNYTVNSIRQVTGFSKTKEYTGTGEPRVYGPKSRRVEHASR